jgi:hypothetical protein
LHEGNLSPDILLFPEKEAKSVVSAKQKFTLDPNLGKADSGVWEDDLEAHSKRICHLVFFFFRKKKQKALFLLRRNSLSTQIAAKPTQRSGNMIWRLIRREYVTWHPSFSGKRSKKALFLLRRNSLSTQISAKPTQGSENMIWRLIRRESVTSYSAFSGKRSKKRCFCFAENHPQP